MKKNSVQILVLLMLSMHQVLGAIKESTSLFIQTQREVIARYCAKSFSDKQSKSYLSKKNRRVITLSGHQDRVTAVAITPDNTNVVTGSWDGTAKIWSRLTGILRHTLVGHNAEINTVAVSFDGKYIVTGSWDNTAKIWNRHTGELLHTLVGHTDGIISVVITPDNSKIITRFANK